jgi:predicted RNA-binding Zn ribbon-like protein
MPRGDLAIVLDLVNSYETDLDAEPAAGGPGAETFEAWLERHPGSSTLPDPPALERWLSDHGIERDAPLGDNDLRAVIRFREALRSLLGANNGLPADPAAVAALRAAAVNAELRVRVDDEGAALLEPAGSGVEALFASVLTAIADAQADGTWTRIKACRADDCRYAFLDESKNRSRAWCSMTVCGNRAKTRSYRARKANREDI